jgi:hypothetical protein
LHENVPFWETLGIERTDNKVAIRAINQYHIDCMVLPLPIDNIKMSNGDMYMKNLHVHKM